MCMRITINLDKRTKNGTPTVHLSEETMSIMKDGKVTPIPIEIDYIENGVTYELLTSKTEVVKVVKRVYG